MENKDDNKKTQEKKVNNPSPETGDEEYEEIVIQKEYKNLCSWLLIFTPDELVIIAAILAILIAKNLTLEEQLVIGSFFTVLADNIFLINSQAVLIQTAIQEQKEIEDKQKEIIKKANDKIQKEIENKEKETTQDDIKTLKEQVKELQDLLKKQLRL